MIALPKINFAHLPTPVEPLPRLSAVLNGPRLFVKRDDLTGLAMGGNKTRKLEYLLAEAQAHGAKTLITAGAAQSNHCRQTAAAAARFGMDCILVLAGEASSPASGNLLLDRLLGAELVWATWETRDRMLKEVFDSAWEAGRRPYLIPYGGSNPTGAAAYCFAIQELIGQMSDQLPDWIIFASSSGGTQAGLVAGGKLFGYPGKILGISIDELAIDLRLRVARLASEVLVLLNEPAYFTPDEVLVNDDYLGGGYGVMGQPELEAISLFARYEGLLLDPVYTARAAAGLIALVRRHAFSEKESVLFWHTGGMPALFADQYRPIVDV